MGSACPTRPAATGRCIRGSFSFTRPSAQVIVGVAAPCRVTSVVWQPPAVAAAAVRAATTRAATTRAATCDPQKSYDRQTEVNSSPDGDTDAWLHAKVCRDLLEEHGPVAGGVYVFHTQGAGGQESVSYTYCDDQPANTLGYGAPAAAN